MPEGFRYCPALVAAAAEPALIAQLSRLPFQEFAFRGYLGKRRVVSFGWRYDFNVSRVAKADPLPAFLLPVRALAADFAQLAPESLEHVLITEYGAGAGIGWHRDRPVFGTVVGISLVSPCLFRFRRRQADGWERARFLAEPRSAYLLQGKARSEWEHSIPQVDALRYSLTFRSLANSAAG
jgi:alkylated DNA repair dioxygenase AlkB